MRALLNKLYSTQCKVQRRTINKSTSNDESGNVQDNVTEADGTPEKTFGEENACRFQILENNRGGSVQLNWMEMSGRPSLHWP